MGVVALPCGGNRNGTSMNNVGSNGNYWSSSANDSNNAYEFYFNATNVNSNNNNNRNNGRSVRLVQDLAEEYFLYKEARSCRLCAFLLLLIR